MTGLANADLLAERHAAFAARRWNLQTADNIAVSPALTWPAFWDQANHVLRECGYAHGTRRQFRHILRGLRQAGIHRPADVTRAGIHAYVHNLADTSSGSWIALNITALRTIFDRLCGLAFTKGLVTPKRGFHLPEIIGENEAERLVQAGSTIRDQLLLGLLYGCGLTATEVTALRWSDIHAGGTQLHVAASTRYAERTQAVPEPFQAILKAGSKTCLQRDHIFTGRRKGTALSTRMVEIIVRQARITAGIERPICVMSLRHSYAVNRLENGANLRQVQQELGHASIRTTARYERCIAPKLAHHPFTEVRRRMTRDAMLRPLAKLATIDIRKLRLPFPRPKATVVEFLSLLRDRVIGGFIKRRTRSP